MKKSIVFLTAFLFAGLGMFAQTKGVLKVTVTTAATGIAGRSYAPRNCLAIWIEDQSGKFVKTLLINAQVRKPQLNTWEASTDAAGSKYNAVDAITGATNSNHGVHICTWDGSDINGKPVPDGKYKILMELTDINGTGNCYSITFTKGNNGINKSLPDKTSFTAVMVEWAPTSKSP
jgi:hypothetical protein